MKIKNEEKELREKTIIAVKEYWQDVKATERYYKINNMKDKLDYRGNLNEEEKQSLLNKYECLEFTNAKYWEREKDNEYVWSFIRCMVNTSEHIYNEISLTNEYRNDVIWNSEIIWTREQVEVYLSLARKFGYKYFVTTDNSTALMHELYDLLSYGAVVVGTCTMNNRENSFGLVLDVSNLKWL